MILIGYKISIFSNNKKINKIDWLINFRKVFKQIPRVDYNYNLISKKRLMNFNKIVILLVLGNLCLCYENLRPVDQETPRGVAVDP